MLLTKDLIYAS